MIRYERIKVPTELLNLYCEDSTLVSIATYADLEARVSQLFLCVKSYEADQRAIRALMVP